MRRDEAALSSRSIIAALALLGLTWLPYALGYARQNAAWRFSGILANELDTNVYLTAIREGQAGLSQFELLFTPERGQPLFIYIFYVWSGRLLAWTGLSPLAVFHLLRSLLTLGLFLLLFAFVRAFVANRAGRWTGYALVTLAGGAGWLLLLIAPPQEGGISPIEFWLMDGFTFFSALLFPHFALAYLLLIGLVLAMHRHFQQGDRRSLGWAWLWTSLLFVVNPKLLPLAAAILTTTVLLIGLRLRQAPWRPVRGLALLGAGTLPWAIFYGLALQRSPALSQLVRQDITLSPPIPHYLSGWGLLWPLAALGAWRVWRRSRRVPAQLMIVAWPLAALLTAYLPFQSNRRMVTALQLPLAVLAAIGLIGVVLPWVYRSHVAHWLAQRGYARRRLAHFAGNGLVAATLPSTLFLLLSFCVGVLTPGEPLFVPAEAVQAQAWLAQHSLDQTTVLASFATGNRLPARTGQRVVLGHWNLTLDFEQKQAEVAAFFAESTPDAERRRLLRRYQVDTLYYGPDERALGAFDPAAAPYLSPVLQKGEVILYQIIVEALP